MSTLSTTNIKHPSSASNNIVLDSSGRVGVGTTSPDNKLHVFAGDSSGSSHASAQLTIENSGNSALQFLAGTSSSSEIRFGDSGDNGAGSIAYVHSDNSLRFGTNNGTEKARIDSSGNLKFNSGYGSVATAYGCRAWVNFDGTGTVAIRASGNVSSITDNGVGTYTVNFSTAMPDANYAALVNTNGANGNDTSVLNFATGSVRVDIWDGGSQADRSDVCVAVIR